MTLANSGLDHLQFSRYGCVQRIDANGPSRVSGMLRDFPLHLY